MRRRRRRNPITMQQSSDTSSSKFREKTYYNYSYSNNNGIKVAVIFGAIIIVFVAVFVIIRINTQEDRKTVAVGNSGTAAPAETQDNDPKETQSSKPDDSAPSANATPVAKSDDVESSEGTGTELVMPTYSLLEFEMQSSRVKIMQQRLMELGFMQQDKTTVLFGNATRRAVIAFQRQHSLKQTGNANTKTLKLMFSAEAQEYKLDDGAKGDDVFQFQDELISLGYMDEHTGYYGSDTARAVKEFQSNNGLPVTGVADRVTIDKLFSNDAKGKD